MNRCFHFWGAGEAFNKFAAFLLFTSGVPRWSGVPLESRSLHGGRAACVWSAEALCNGVVGGWCGLYPEYIHNPPPPSLSEWYGPPVVGHMGVIWVKDGWRGYSWEKTPGRYVYLYSTFWASLLLSVPAINSNSVQNKTYWKQDIQVHH